MEFTAERLRSMAAELGGDAVQGLREAARQDNQSRNVFLAAAETAQEAALAFRAGADAMEECARLRGALAEARKQAIEDAAQAARGCRLVRTPSMKPPNLHWTGFNRGVDESVAAIRALLASPPPSTQTGENHGH